MQTILKKVEKVVMKGFSGVEHIVEVVKVGNEKYVYIDLTKENEEKSLGKVILAYDVGMKCAIVVNGEKPSWIDDVFKNIGGIMIETN
ncbi:MAG: hypothetical protein B6U76_02315 [Desulfurococcales archaeon ex4484_217_2]|nr:MAG: hypothetical protein B6U76_02315 [Desulfurococcales archaeon ex4484_217_2]